MVKISLKKRDEQCRLFFKVSAPVKVKLDEVCKLYNNISYTDFITQVIEQVHAHEFSGGNYEKEAS